MAPNVYIRILHGPEDEPHVLTDDERGDDADDPVMVVQVEDLELLECFPPEQEDVDAEEDDRPAPWWKALVVDLRTPTTLEVRFVDPNGNIVAMAAVLDDAGTMRFQGPEIVVEVDEDDLRLG